MNIPSGLNNIQPRSTQVWNCDKIGFDSNGIISKEIKSGSTQMYARRVIKKINKEEEKA